MCDNPNVLEAMYIVKTIITIIKVLVPIMLIVFISLDYAGAVKSGDEDVMKKANKATVTKLIAGVCIFLVPMFVDVVIRFSSNGSVDVNDCYTNATKENIQIIKSPVGMPGRALRNKFIEKVEQSACKVEKCYGCLAKCKPAEIPYCITDALIKAVKGDIDNGLVFCGSNTGRITQISTVKQVMEELMAF